MKKPLMQEQLDPSFKYRVMKEPGGEKLALCFACDTCTLSCPVRVQEEAYHPRTIIRLILLGAKQEVLADPVIWLCASCFQCQERCPQGVGVTDLINAVKNIACREGFIPKSMTMQMGLLAKHGRLLEIGDFENKKRDKQQLPLIKEQPEDIQRIIDLSGAARYLPQESE
jgi:heterodisulfide reductase subunit C